MSKLPIITQVGINEFQQHTIDLANDRHHIEWIERKIEQITKNDSLLGKMLAEMHVEALNNPTSDDIFALYGMIQMYILLETQVMLDT